MMTKLMKQLQQWANEGRYDWENGTFKWEGIYINNPPLAGWEVFVQLVLEGTIQVWRPVEHYKPATGMDGLALIGEEVFSGVFVCFPITDQVWFMKDNTEVWLQNITHWQPLPQFIHEEKETNNV